MVMKFSKEETTRDEPRDECDHVVCSCDFDDDDDDDVIQPEYVFKWKAVATVAVCAMAAAVHCITGDTGIGWGIVGVIVIWH